MFPFENHHSSTFSTPDVLAVTQLRMSHHWSTYLIYVPSQCSSLLLTVMLLLLP